MIDRYDAPMGMVAVRGKVDDENNVCTGCAMYKNEHIQRNCPYLCRDDEREDGENVIFKTRADFEAMLLQELEQFYGVKITKPVGEVTYRPDATIEEEKLKRLFTWYAVKKEEYETLQKDIMEGEKDKELWIATLKVDRKKYKDEMERLKEIDNYSDYRTYDKQFNTELYKQTDKIIIELEKWQTYLSEG